MVLENTTDYAEVWKVGYSADKADGSTVHEMANTTCQIKW